MSVQVYKAEVCKADRGGTWGEDLGLCEPWPHDVASVPAAEAVEVGAVSAAGGVVAAHRHVWGGLHHTSHVAPLSCF